MIQQSKLTIRLFKKEIHLMKTIFFVLFCFRIIHLSTYSQALKVGEFFNPYYAARSIFPPQAEIIDAWWDGYTEQYCHYQFTIAGFPFKSGILITNGKCKEAFNLNNQNDFLGICAGCSSYYKLGKFCMKVIPHQPSIRFNYFFGSEEYPEYLNVDDNLKITVKGHNAIWGPFGPMNIAILPNNQFVSVPNVNSNTNSEYYNDNVNPSPYTYDGFTILLEAKIENLSPDSICEVCFIVEDGSLDEAFDSGVFVEVVNDLNLLSTTVTDTKEAIKIYPNPAYANFNVILFEQLIGKEIEIQLVTLQGQMLISEKTQVQSTIYTLDCSGIDAGIYMLYIKAENTFTSQKIIITR
jgi:hypothetical protein